MNNDHFDAFAQIIHIVLELFYFNFSSYITQQCNLLKEHISGEGKIILRLPRIDPKNDDDDDVQFGHGRMKRSRPIGLNTRLERLEDI